MTETSSDKTTRKLISLLREPVWCYQISIFYNNYSDCIHAHNHMQVIKDQLPRSLPEQSFIYRLCLTCTEATHFDDIKDKAEFGDKVEAAYHTMFTIDKTPPGQLQDDMSRRLGLDVRVKTMVFDELRRIKYLAALKKNDLHDLKRFFKSDRQIRRYALIGKKYIPEDRSVSAIRNPATVIPF